MSSAAVVLVVLGAAGFPLLLWAIGRAVSAAGERARHGLGRPRQYLAGRLDGLQITTLIDGGDELLVGLSTLDADASRATRDLLANVFHVSARECSLSRVRRWRDEGTLLLAYLSHDGAVMFADPVLGGTAAWQDRKLASSQDQSPSDDS